MHQYPKADVLNLALLLLARALCFVPQHIQYDSKECVAYTFIYIDSMVTKWDYYKAKAGIQKEAQKYSKADYMKQVKTNNDTQAVMDSVIGFITSHNYNGFHEVVALVEDATDQLGFADEAKKKAEAYAAKGDFQNATLWAGQHWQYRVKTADPGLRAKKVK